MDGRTVEVRGVPDLLPDERTVDKLLIYFLRKKHGGGEVQKVVYPCYQAGQAFVTFEEREVAARVLSRSPHVLELNGQRFRLTVRAARQAQVDFLVEATLQLNAVPVKVEVQEILRSHGFELLDLSSHHVRVEGPFLKLKGVKASLEMLLESAARVGVAPPPPPGPKVSSEAACNHHTDVSDAKRGPLASQHPPASPSSSSSSSSLKDPPGTPERPGSDRTGKARLVVDSDVYDYAKRLRKKDVDAVLDGHDARVRVAAADGCYSLSLRGTSANACMKNLQRFLENLHKSLGRQEVPLKDLTPEGERLAGRIRDRRNIYKSVLVQQRSGALHLLGPPEQSHQLQQALLGRAEPAQQRGRSWRSSEGGAGRRSSSLPTAAAPPAGEPQSRQEAADARRRLGGADPRT